MTDPVQALVARLDGHGYDPRRAGPDSWKSRCPGHDGAGHSLSINEGNDGRALLYCHAHGCEPRDIAAPLGLTEADLFPTRPGTAERPDPRVQPKRRKVHKTPDAAIAGLARRFGPPTAWWRYHDAEGREVARVYRFDPPDAEKEYRPVHATEGGWAIGDPPGPWPLYRLPDLAGADLIIFPEGEKAAELAWGIGLAATTTAHGAKSPHKTDLSPLAGKTVIVLPDADPPGEAYAAALVGLLAMLYPRPTVKIVRLAEVWRDGP